MALIINSPDPLSIIAIALIIGILVVAYVKKIRVTFALIFANLLIYFPLTILFPNQIFGDLGFRPIYLTIDYSPQLYTLFTSMFVHGDPLHIIGNMLVFFFMGIAFEERVGWKKFLIIYLITGICGALAHSLLNLGSPIILIGASGAVFGILGAFASSYPSDEVVMPIPVGIMFITKIKVLYAAIIFAAMETLFVYLGGQGNTAHFAHFGGLVSGIVLAVVLVGKQGKRLKSSQNIQSYSLNPGRKPVSIDFSNLKKLATTPELTALYDKIKNETVPQVQQIWLDYFLQRTHCPVCGKPLQHKNRTIWCEDNHFTTTI